jgi:L-ascorbate metabolism protein UlaG (beta-lactamase superfamily)
MPTFILSPSRRLFSAPTRWRRSAKIFCAALFVSALIACGSSYKGPITPHFDGNVFSNPGYQRESTPAGYLWRRLTIPKAEWPESIEIEAVAPPPQRVIDGTARITLVGHATILIQVAGLNIITDPFWSDRASPFSFAGPKRATRPGVAFDALPPIDVVLISHNHYDHLDLPTLRRLDARDRPRVIVPLGNRPLVQSAMPESEVSEHDWGSVVSIKPDTVIAVEPMLHGSGRTPFDQQKTLWAAFVLNVGGFKIYHVGDAGYGDGQIYRDAAAKFGGFDLAILPIGAYEPQSFMKNAHMTPAQALMAMNDAKAKRALAHHFGALALGFESYEAPPAALKAALLSAKLPPESFPALAPGQSILLARP